MCTRVCARTHTYTHKDIHPRAHSLVGHNCQHPISPKPGPRSFIWASHTGSRCPSLWATLCCISQANSRNWIRSGASGHKLVPIRDASIASVGLYSIVPKHCIPLGVFISHCVKEGEVIWYRVKAN